MRLYCQAVLASLLVSVPCLAASTMEVDVAIKTVETTEADPQARFKAVQKLGQLKNPKAIPCLIAALKPAMSDPEGDWFVRKAAVTSLVQIGSASLEPLKKMVDDPSPMVRARTLEALTRLKAPGILELLAAKLKGDPDEKVRTECVIEMRDLGDKLAIPALRAAAKDDKSAALRERAAHVADKLDAGS